MTPCHFSGNVIFALTVLFWLAKCWLPIVCCKFDTESQDKFKMGKTHFPEPENGWNSYPSITTVYAWFLYQIYCTLYAYRYICSILQIFRIFWDSVGLKKENNVGQFYNNTHIILIGSMSTSFISIFTLTLISYA